MKKMLKTMVLGMIALLALAMVPAGFADLYGTELTKTEFNVDNAPGSSITLVAQTQDGTDANDLRLKINGVDFGKVTFPDEPHSSYAFVTLPLTYLDSMLGTDFNVVAGESYTLTVKLGSSFSDDITINIAEAVPTLLAPDLIDEVDYEDEAAPGDEIPVTIELKTDEGDRYEDVTIEAWIVDDEGDRVTDREETGEFNIGKSSDDDEEERTLVLELPSNAEEGEYYVIVEVEGEVDSGMYEGMSGLLAHVAWDETTKSNELKIDVERDDHAVDIENIAFDSTVTAGETVDLAVTLENIGLNDEDVRVRVTVPELGISQTSDFITVEEDELVTNYFTLRIPGTSDAGEYQMTIKVYNDDLSETENFELAVRSTAVPVATGLSVNVDSPTKTIDMTGGVYAITVMNNGDETRTLNFEVAGEENWATASVNPGTVIVQPGTSKIVSVFVSPMDSTRGTNQFTVFVKEGASVLDSMTMTANISPSLIPGFGFDANTALKWIIGFLVLVLVVLFVVWSWRREEIGGKRRRR